MSERINITLEAVGSKAIDDLAPTVWAMRDACASLTPVDIPDGTGRCGFCVAVEDEVDFGPATFPRRTLRMTFEAAGVEVIDSAIQATASALSS